MAALEKLEQPRTPRPGAFHPFELVGARVCVAEDALRQLLQGLRVGVLADRKAADEHAADAIGSFRVIVSGSRRVRRTGGEDVDVVPERELLGKQTRGMLRSPRDVGAVSRRN